MPRQAGVSTIRDVAAKAKVAISTVSFVFGDAEARAKVADKTARQVRLAARQVGYYPNAAARALRRRCTECLGLLLPADLPANRMLSPSQGMTVTNVEFACAAQCYGLQVRRQRSDPETTLAWIASRPIDGLLVMDEDNPELLALCRRMGIPLVDMVGTLGTAPTCAVEVDVVAGRLEAVRYAASKGHRRIGMTRLNKIRQRRVYDSVMGQAASILPDCEFVRFDVDRPADTSDGPLLMKAWEALPPAERPTILLAHESILISFLSEMADRGIRCPQDLSLVGLSRTFHSDMTQPRLSGIEVSDEDSCAIAVNLLVDHIKAGTLPTREDSPPLLSCQLVERQSCAPPQFERSES